MRKAFGRSNELPRLWLRFCLVLSLLGSSVTLAQTGEPVKLLFLGPTHPVLIEFEFLAGRFSISEVRSNYAKEVFKLLDEDENQILDEHEARQIPKEGRLRVGVDRMEEDWVSVDVSPEDGKISFAELEQHISSALGPTLSVERAPPKLAATVRLFSDLDGNSDGKISQDEVKTGLEILHSFDFDDDETLSVAELQPFPLSVVQAQRETQAEEEPVPMFFLRNQEEIEAAITGAFQHYRAENTLSAKLLVGLHEREFSRFDLNDDGAWDHDDLELYLKRARPDYMMEVSLSPPLVTVRKGEYQGEKRPTTLIGKLPVEWIARNNAYQQFDATRLYLVRFIMSDVDKNRYLDPMEFAGLQANASFEEVDIDGNSQVTRDEIKFFFTMDGMASQSRLILSLSNETKTLFEILDKNLDRRLSSREFMEGPGSIAEFDLNQDQALLPDELNSKFRVTFTQPKLFEIDPLRDQNTMMNQRQGIVRPQTSGPLWFGRMDDNLDGEVSWREFLGPRDKFDELDQNSDNYITLSEAEAAEAQRSTE